MNAFTASVKKYSPLWHKYRPVLLKLMVESAREIQTYQMSSHEFRDIDSKQKGGHSFTLRFFNSRPQNDIKTSVVAQDLLMILQQSGKAHELSGSAVYEFVMDKQFVLTVSREEIAAEEEETEEPNNEES